MPPPAGHHPAGNTRLWDAAAEPSGGGDWDSVQLAAYQKEQRERHRRHRAITPPEVPGHELLRIIGMGAYGEVWLAQTREGEYRAVKVVWREDFNNAEFYEQELAGNRLYEPLSRGNYGLAPLLQVGCHGSEYFYCVMELADDINGGGVTDPATYCPRTLRNVMSRYGRRPIPLDPVIGAGLYLAHGLACLHRAGLTHCDIKPSNIIYIGGHPCLADAGMVSPPGKRNCSGTEGYIPPEGPGSKKADIYALAMVLYEMATNCDRHDFPTLPAGLPDGNERWLAFNRILCAAGDPSPTRRRITSATQLGHRLEALRHPPVFPLSGNTGVIHSLKQLWQALPHLAWLGASAAVLLFLAALCLLPDGFLERLPHAWEVLMGSRK